MKTIANEPIKPQNQKVEPLVAPKKPFIEKININNKIEKMDESLDSILKVSNQPKNSKPLNEADELNFNTSPKPPVKEKQV